MRLTKKSLKQANQSTELLPEFILQEFKHILELQKQKNQQPFKEAKEQFIRRYKETNNLLIHVLTAVIDFKSMQMVNEATINALKLKNTQETAKQVGAICRALIRYNLISARDITQLAGAIYLPRHVKLKDYVKENILVKIKHISDKDLSAFLAASCVTTIDLSWNNIGDSEVKTLLLVLKDNHNINRIKLHNSNIGAEEAKILALALKVNHSVTTIELGGNSIGDAGVETLTSIFKDNHTIFRIDLSSNNISNVGAKTLALALKDNHSIGKLKLHANNIGEEGVQSLLEMLKHNRHITFITLHSNSIGEKSSAYRDQIREQLNNNGKFIQNKIPQFKKTIFNLFCVRECLIKSNQLNFPKPIMTKIAMHTDKEIHELGINNIQRY